MFSQKFFVGRFLQGRLPDATSSAWKNWKRTISKVEKKNLKLTNYCYMYIDLDNYKLIVFTTIKQ